MMIPNVHYSELGTADMFLLLRFYKMRLTDSDKEM